MTLTGPPPGHDPELWALVAPLRAAMAERGMTRGQLAYIIRCDRSRVSRALSGRVLPARQRVVDLARAVGADDGAAGRQWDRAADRLRDPRVRRDARTAGGAPPSRMATHMDLMRALRVLLRERRVSQRELERRDPRLRRSTIGAVLRGQRGAHQHQVTAIVAACGVQGDAARAWDDAWARLSAPDLAGRRDRADAWIRATAVPRRWLDRW